MLAGEKSLWERSRTPFSVPTRKAFTKAPPKSLKGQIGFLLKQLKTPPAVAAELGVSRRSVEYYRKGDRGPGR